MYTFSSAFNRLDRCTLHTIDRNEMFGFYSKTAKRNLQSLLYLTIYIKIRKKLRQISKLLVFYIYPLFENDDHKKGSIELNKCYYPEEILPPTPIRICPNI